MNQIRTEENLEFQTLPIVGESRRRPWAGRRWVALVAFLVGVVIGGAIF